MAGEARLAPFVAEDGFLRRTKTDRHIKNGTVSWEAFKPRGGEPGLSFTYQNDQLKSEKALKQYQLQNELSSRDLPGICMLTFDDLTIKLEPPLSPRLEEDRKDETYGKLHCLTELPSSQPQMEQMAAFAERHQEFGLPFPLIRKKHRKDL